MPYSDLVYSGALKGRRTLALTIALFFLVAFVATGGEPKSTVPPVYSVTRAKAAPIIDGVLDDPAWEDVPAEPLEWVVDAAITWNDPNDFEGSFKAVWREGTLYVALMMQDDGLVINPDEPTRSDRMEFYITTEYGDSGHRYTVPLLETSSLEDANIPFAAWSSDARVCEFSIETEVMYRENPELLINFYYVDVDPGDPDVRIGWVPHSGYSTEPQYGTLRFRRRLGPDAHLVTTWGNVKTLY